MGTARPLILGLGGALRRNSATERLLRVGLAAAEAEGASTVLIAGEDLDLPLYVPGVSARTAAARRLVEAYRACDGLILASPAYHGSISGVVKNALDYAEDLRMDSRVYLDGCAIGCICCAGGWQAAGQTLGTLRAIAHALRGWPTPLGVAVNTSVALFDDSGRPADRSVTAQLELLARQVVTFARNVGGDQPRQSCGSVSGSITPKE
jgi:FMN reductase